MRAIVAKVVAWCERHPLLVVALIAGLSGLLSAWSIWHQRHVGNLDPDEAGYLAAALRYQRSVDPAHPGALLSQISRSVTGPLVPLLSVVPLTLGPRDVRAAVLVQPAFVVMAAVATTAMCRRIAPVGYAILAGAFLAAVPAVVMASETYWFGLGAAAGYGIALWALVSERGLDGGRRWWVAVGLAIALLSRTMSLAFVPAFVVGGLVVAWGHRRRLVGLVEVVGLGILLALPWYVVRRQEIFGYLFSYGYGTSAARFGSGGPGLRMLMRTYAVGQSSFMYGVEPWPGGGFLMLVVAAVLLWRYVPRRRLAEWDEVHRAGLALGAFVLLGIVALATSTNGGIWFELPLAGPTVALGLAVVARLPRPPRLAAVSVLCALAVLGPVVVRATDYGWLDVGFAEYDHRLEHRRSEQAEAGARSWAEVNERIAHRVAALTERDPRRHVAVTGNMFIVNGNTITLAAEQDLWEATIDVPDTQGDPASWRRLLRRPWVKGLVVVRYDGTHFVPDAHWRRVERDARALGWEQVARWPLPGDRGGEVVLLTPPAAPPR